MSIASSKAPNLPTCRSNNRSSSLDGPLPSLAIPTTLQASLMARLDRLAPVREVAQIGAVARREFHYELLLLACRRRDWMRLCDSWSNRD
jgi:hypothetical protein